MKTFLAGLGLGFGIGLLLAPQRGEQTREQLRRRGSDLADAVGEQVREVVRNPGEVLRQGQERVTELGRQLTEQLETHGKKIKDAVQSKVSPVGLNSVSREDLLTIYGIGPVMADRIISGRPYTSDRQVVEQGIVPEGIFERLERELLKKRA
jgi:gas vesicle protein